MSWADEAKSEIVSRLKEIFGKDLVEDEWMSQAENEDWLKIGKVYAPRPDIVIGPLNIHSGVKANKERENIEEVFKKHSLVFQNLSEKVDPNGNENPRCLLAIEIEDSNTGKYMMGNFVNASILGKIGLVVVNKDNKGVWEDAERVEKFLRGALYHKKIKIATNTVLFEYSQFMAMLDKVNGAEKEDMR